MAVSLSPPKRKTSSEARIEEVVGKGGKTTAESEQERESNDIPKHVNARLTEGIIRQINALRAARPRKPGSPKMGVSLHDWVVEAVLEKLERDEKRRKSQ